MDGIDRRFVSMGATIGISTWTYWIACFAGAPVGRIVGGDATKFSGWLQLNAEYGKRETIEASLSAIVSECAPPCACASQVSCERGRFSYSSMESLDTACLIHPTRGVRPYRSSLTTICDAHSIVGIYRRLRADIDHDQRTDQVLGWKLGNRCAPSTNAPEHPGACPNAPQALPP